MTDQVTVKVPVGIAGDGLTEIERTISADEPPPLPPNVMLASIGKPTARLDGRLKVTGAARYTSDVRLPGMLFARIVRSPHAHARILAIDTGAAERVPGVRAVQIVEHLLGSAQLRDPSKELPSSFPVVRYVGQPIAAVAATTQAIADEAARLVRVEYERLPFVVDLEEARRPDAPLVFPAAADQAGSAGGGGGPAGVPQTGNVRGPARSGPHGSHGVGDVERGLAEADVVVDQTYRTQVQTHSAMETHGLVADWGADGLTVYASTQGTGSVRDELAEVLGLPKAKVRVVTEFMGGGFGAKFGAGNYGVLAARLAKKAGAPVRLMLDRREEHEGVGNRPSSVARLRIGARKDGTLTAIHFVSYGTAGTGSGAGAGGPAKNLYPCPNVLVEESDVFTNAGPAAAFRAPGHPQGAFGLEQSIDELAEKLGMDPLALRDRIDVDDPDEVWDAAAARKVERRIGAEKAGWSARHAPGADPRPLKRGLGVAQALWYRFVNLDSTCEVRIARDGSIEVLSAVQDIGGGIRTALAQVVAEELGVRPQEVTVRIGDTSFPPGPASGGSVTTGSISPAARNAAYKVKRELYAQVAAAAGSMPEALMKSMPLRAAAAKMRTEQVTAQATRSDDYGGFAQGGRARRGMGIGGYGGVQFAEVAVDVETGVVKVERVVAVHDCGRPLNPLAIEGQIHGGIIQGLSYALYENRVLDRRSGWMLNANFESYKIAGAREVPRIEVHLIEEYRGRSSTDAGGIGEPATVATAAAVANAVHNATGVRVRELPMTPERVLAALTRQKEAAR
ncbi:MAG TPA: xanthine dehydrogenase family protein molybdopterin-binding subunit [Polyangiaceae bacterium]|jgi:xanthine dehydrogenase YagR molybdenum-binding subunit